MSVAIAAPEPHTDIDRIPGLVAGLRDAFDRGLTRPLDWREAQLRGLERLIAERGDELLAALQADLAKPAVEAWAADIGVVRMEAAQARKKLQRWTRPEKVGLLPIPGRMRIIREPLGVVLIIAPWNYPVQLLLTPLIGAIAAGNAAMLKPSEVTAHTSDVLAKRVPEYLDPEAICLIEGGVEETSALLAERWDHIFYTGNGSVARIVMEAAAKHLTPVTMELGGKSPCIVDGDVDVEIAARRIAWGKWLNAGQTCVAPDYVLVKREREDELVEALARCVKEFYGDDPQQTEDYARIVNERHRQRVARLLKDGKPAFGGETDENDRYVAPTVLRDVSPDSNVMQEEIFGPVLPVLPIDSIDEAVAFVNERDKPLALYLFTGDREVEEDVLARTSSGGVCVNGTILHLASPELPFGGVGPSGMGTYHGRFSFETFSHKKSVLSRGLRFDPKLMYPPYSNLKTRLLKKFL
ncbi:MAG: aldehyde dehydrogenase family protein [Myxococcota bacterium]